MFLNNQSIKDYDPDLWKALKGELGRQEDHIELIASENYTSMRFEPVCLHNMRDTLAKILRWMRIC